MISLINSTKNLATNKKAKDNKKRSTETKNSIVNFSITENEDIKNSEKLLKSRAIQKKRISTQSVSSKAKSVSAMLAINNLIFISLTLPIVVFLSKAPPINEVCDHEKSKLLLIKVICIILMNSNCTVSIFIYYFMSSQFKVELKRILLKIIPFGKKHEYITQTSTFI